MPIYYLNVKIYIYNMIIYFISTLKFISKNVKTIKTRKVIAGKQYYKCGVKELFVTRDEIGSEAFEQSNIIVNNNSCGMCLLVHSLQFQPELEREWPFNQA